MSINEVIIFKYYIIILIILIVSLNTEILSQTPLIIQKIDGISLDTVKKDEIKLSIQTDKSEFVEFEPISLLFTYINCRTKPDTVFHMFYRYSNDLKIQIESSEGEIYSIMNRWQPDVFHDYDFVLEPGDTLNIPVIINDYGREVPNRSFVYFNQQGFLPKGKYTITSTIEIDGRKIFNPPLVSNSVYIEVKEISKSDQRLLDSIKKWKDEYIKNIKLLEENSYFEKLEENHSLINESIFKEHILMDYLNSAIAKYHDEPDKSQIIMDAYNDFLLHFPNSYYTFDNKFILWFVMEGITRNDKNYFLSRIQEINKQYPNSAIIKFLTSSIMKEYIERLDRYKKNQQ